MKQYTASFPNIVQNPLDVTLYTNINCRLCFALTAGDHTNGHNSKLHKTSPDGEYQWAPRVPPRIRTWL